MGIEMNMHEEDTGKAWSFMSRKSMTFVYYSNTWHDTFAKVGMLGDGKERSLGPGAKKQNRDLRIIQEIKNNRAQWWLNLGLSGSGWEHWTPYLGGKWEAEDDWVWDTLNLRFYGTWKCIYAQESRKLSA